MNKRQAGIAVVIVSLVLGAPFVGHLVRSTFHGDAGSERLPSESVSHPDAAARATTNDGAPNGAEELAVLGVIGKTFDAMRDQASMTVSGVGVVHASKAVTACLEYASKNGFGGVNRGYAVWQLNEATTFRFSIDDVGQWNRRCAKRQLVDYTDTGRELLQKMKERSGF